jgi:hypothetical protein
VIRDPNPGALSAMPDDDAAVAPRQMLDDALGSSVDELKALRLRLAGRLDLEPAERVRAMDRDERLAAADQIGAS